MTEESPFARDAGPLGTALSSDVPEPDADSAQAHAANLAAVAHRGAPGLSDAERRALERAATFLRELGHGGGGTDQPEGAQ